MPSIPVFILSLALLLVGCQEREPNIRPNNVLSRIETYVAPPNTSSGSPETYDFRKNRGLPVPASWTDTFACDILVTIKQDLQVNILNASDVPPEFIKHALDFYNTPDSSRIRGFKAWKHWNFIRSLNKGDLNTLSDELVTYLNSKGSKLYCPSSL